MKKEIQIKRRVCLSDKLAEHAKSRSTKARKTVSQGLQIIVTEDMEKRGNKK